jgi:hypothetical protein
MAQADILDLLQTRLRGRESDWQEDWEDLREQGRIAMGYDEFREQRKREALESGKDWPARYLLEVDHGAFTDSFSAFVKERLDAAIESKVADRRDRQARLGLVFVHGIGNQRKGETLLGFGEPLVRWIRGWMKELDLEFDRWQHWGAWPAEKNAYRELEYAHLSDARVRETEGGAPAHATLTLPLLDEKWLLTEAWWADEVYAPPIRRLVLWLAAVAPMLVLTHLSRMFMWRTRAVRNIGPLAMIPAWIAGFVATSLLATVFALGLQAAVLVMGLLALVPVGRLRAGVRGVLLSIATTLGDSLSFTDNPIARAALVSQVSRAIQFASERCETVAVIAHSQGAAIAHRSLQERAPDNVRLLVTLGAGVNKLGTLHSRGRRRALFEGLTWAMCLAPLFVLYVFSFTPFQSSFDLYVLLFILMAYLTAWLDPLFTSRRVDLLSLKPIEWIDFYSRQDPVSNGPMTLTETDVVDSREINNFDSILGDHTAYWKNRDEFIPSLMQSLAEVGAPELFESHRVDRQRLETWRKRRRVRVRWLSALRRSFWLGALLLIVLSRGRLATIAREEMLVGKWRFLTNWIDGWLEESSLLVQVFPRFEAQADALRELSLAVIGAVGVILSFGVWYGLGLLVWHWWNRSAMLRVPDLESESFPRGSVPAPPLLFALLSAALFGLLLLPLVAATLADLGTTASHVLGLATAVFVFFGGMIVYGTHSVNIGPHRTMDRKHAPLFRYLLPIIGAIALIAWLTVQGIISDSVVQPYRTLWFAVEQLATTAQKEPIVLAPFALPGFWVMGAIINALQELQGE